MKQRLEAASAQLTALETKLNDAVTQAKTDMAKLGESHAAEKALLDKDIAALNEAITLEQRAQLALKIRAQELSGEVGKLTVTLAATKAESKKGKQPQALHMTVFNSEEDKTTYNKIVAAFTKNKKTPRILQAVMSSDKKTTYYQIRLSAPSEHLNTDMCIYRRNKAFKEFLEIITLALEKDTSTKQKWNALKKCEDGHIATAAKTLGESAKVAFLSTKDDSKSKRRHSDFNKVLKHTHHLLDLLYKTESVDKPKTLFPGQTRVLLSQSQADSVIMQIFTSTLKQSSPCGSDKYAIPAMAVAATLKNAYNAFIDPASSGAKNVHGIDQAAKETECEDDDADDNDGQGAAREQFKEVVPVAGNLAELLVSQYQQARDVQQ